MLLLIGEWDMDSVPETGRVILRTPVEIIGEWDMDSVPETDRAILRPPVESRQPMCTLLAFPLCHNPPHPHS
jgi:hypothetical protein